MFKSKLMRKLFFWLALEMGALMGVPVRPDQIEKLMRIAGETKVVRSIPDDARP
jgi:hypothetical protein